MLKVDSWVWALIVALSVLSAGGVVYGAAIASRRAGMEPTLRTRVIATASAVMFGWLALASGLAAAGVIRATPRSVFQAIGLAVALPVVAGVLVLMRSRTLHSLVDAINQEWLLAAQFPRVAGGIFLVLLAQGLLPSQFALPAGIGDVAIGLLAPLVAYFYLRKGRGYRQAAFIFGLAGIADLVVAVGTGFLSAPTPFRLLQSNPSTELMSVLPMALIPIFLVPLFVLLHIVSLRKLSAELKQGAATLPRAFSPVAR
jgi:hypothetical protein